MNEEQENITLEDFLNHFDFSYCLYKDKNYPNMKIEGGKIILWQDIQSQ